jgi:hypothetical protein
MPCLPKPLRADQTLAGIGIDIGIGIGIGIGIVTFDRKSGLPQLGPPVKLDCPRDKVRKRRSNQDRSMGC